MSSKKRGGKGGRGGKAVRGKGGKPAPKAANGSTNGHAEPGLEKELST